MTGGPPDRTAIFVDRDGTLIRERIFLADPEGVEILPGAVEGLGVLAAAGYDVVIVTNQSGIARGYFDDAVYRAVQDEVTDRLARAGVPVLASYHCPHHPDLTGPCRCRKPGPELFERAAREHGIDLRRSAFVGDRLRDVLPGVAFGGQAVLVRTGYGAEEEAGAGPGIGVAEDLREAAMMILQGAEHG